jgi:hypothetical protein
MAWVATNAGRSAANSGGRLAALAGGSIEVLTAADAVLFAATLPTPAGTESNGVITLTASPYSGATAGTMTKCRTKNAAGTVLENGTAGATGDLVFASATVTTGQAGMIGGTLTQPAS